MKKGVYRFAVDCGRMGDLNGVFIATDVAIERATGKTAYFHECLGKHSEYDIELGDDYITLISDNPEVVAVVEEHDLSSGFNPLDHINEDIDEEDDEEC